MVAPPQHEAGGAGRSGHDDLVFGSDKFDPLGGGLLGDEPQVSSARLRSLILSKEKELHDINQFRIDTLEQMLTDRDRIIGEMGERMKKMKEDFQYNLRLIEERDAELDRYDATFAELKENLREKDKEISELKISISEMEAKKNREVQRLGDVEASYQTKLRDMREEMDMMRLQQEEGLRRKREEMDALRHDLERQLRERDEDMEAQRREITFGFDEVIRQRELETKRREDELLAQLRHMEREAGIKNRALEKLDVQERLIDEQAAKIQQLQIENQELQLHAAALGSEHEDKVRELVETLHAVEKAFVMQRAEHEQEKGRLEARYDTSIKAAIEKRDAKIDSLKEVVSQSEERLTQLEYQLRESRREMDDKVATKSREIDAQESHFSAELERQESAALELKTQLWNAEAELKQIKFKLDDACKAAEDRGREVLRLREQVQLQRDRLDSAGKEVLGRVDELRREYEARDEKNKAAHEETLAMASEQMEAVRQERDELRRRVAGLDAELGRRQEQIYELQDSVVQLQQQAALAATHQAAAEEARAATRGGASERGASPLFSEDLGPASPLMGGDRALGSDGRRAWGSPVAHSPGYQAMVDENERLLAVIADMRREMDALRDMSQRQSAELRHSQSKAGPTLAELEQVTRALEEANTHRQEQQQRLEEVLRDNRRMTDENHKLKGNCEKLMAISNELKSRVQKMTERQGFRDDDILPTPPARSHQEAASEPHPMSIDPPALPPAPPSEDLVPPRRDPYLGLGAEPKMTEASRRKSGASAATRPTSTSAKRSQAASPELDSEGRHRLEQVRDELLLAGGAAVSHTVHLPTTLPARASDRTTKGQKKALTRLKEGKQSRLDLANERKKIRNYAIRDDT